MVQGMEAVELDESFNKVRRRLNETAKAKIAFENGAGEDFDPYADLSFKTAEGGRISVNYEKVIGVGSDEAKDQGSGD